MSHTSDQNCIQKTAENYEQIEAPLIQNCGKEAYFKTAFKTQKIFLCFKML